MTLANATLSIDGPGPGLVVGFDPSIRACGWAVIRPRRAGERRPTRVASGTWSPSTSAKAPDRFDQLSDFVAATLREHVLLTAHCPLPTDAVVIEVPSGGIRQHPSTLMTYARAIGVIEATARAVLGLAPMRVPVNTWKGTGSKETTLRKVFAEFDYAADDDNEADAIGLAAWYAANWRQFGLVQSINGRRRK